MFILKKEHQPGVYVPLWALFLVVYAETLAQISCADQCLYSAQCFIAL